MAIRNPKHSKSAKAQQDDLDLPKYYSYRMAWGRIKTAMEQGFYLEVVTIAEGIMSDRLTSQLFQCGISPKDDRFATLIRCWRDHLTGNRAIIQLEENLLKEAEKLIQDIDDWRKKRNRIVHGIVKGKQGQYASRKHPRKTLQNDFKQNYQQQAPPIEENYPDIENFIQEAQQSAVQGKLLARKICQWHRILSKLCQSSQEPTQKAL